MMRMATVLLALGLYNGWALSRPAAAQSLEERGRVIDQEIAKQQRLAKSVAEERARLRAVAAFFGKS